MSAHSIIISTEAESFIRANSTRLGPPEWNNVVNKAIETLSWVSKRVPCPLNPDDMEVMKTIPLYNTVPYNHPQAILDAHHLTDESFLPIGAYKTHKKIKYMSQFEQWAILAHLKKPLIMRFNKNTGPKRGIIFSPESGAFVKSQSEKKLEWTRVVNETIYTLEWVIQHTPNPLDYNGTDLMLRVTNKNTPPYNLHAAFLEACNVESEKYLSGPAFELAQKLKKMSQFEQWAILAKLKSPLIS